MEQIQKASLVLKSHSLPMNGSNAFGSTNEFKTRMTWNNINFRLLLGDMYDKFDNFNIQLVIEYLTYSKFGSDDDRILNNGVYINEAGVDHSDRIVSIYMSGMNFLNSTYDSKTNQIGTKAVLTTYDFYKDFPRNIHNSIFTFTKGNEVCNITIEYMDIYTDSSPATASSFPNMVFVFNIYGIPKEIKKLN